MFQVMRRGRNLLACLYAGVLVLCAAAVSPAGAPVTSSGVCSVALTPLAFGTYNPLGHHDLVTVAMLHYRCSGTHRRLIVALGAGDAGSFNVRRMGHGNKAIRYNLYMDAAGTRVWGDGSNGTEAYIINNPSSASEVSLPLYGRIFPGQNAPAGDYSDHVSVVVEY